MFKFGIFARSLILVPIFAPPLLAPSPAWAVEAPVTECDRLAASPLDYDKVAHGVGQKNLDALPAIEACWHAVEIWPAAARLQYQLARALVKAEEYSEGFEIMARLAVDTGYAVAQLNLGLIYGVGDAVPRDDAKALYWFRRAAESGHPLAQYFLGNMYVEGKGVPRDSAEAAKWYRKAAEQGDAEAQFELGWLYAKGEGVPRDDARALKWLRKAAEQDYASAQFDLGEMYSEGDGVPRSDAEAVKWYRRAAEQGMTAAQNNLGLMYDRGRGVPADHVLAYFWYSIAASGGSDVAFDNRKKLAETITSWEEAEAQRLTRICWDNMANCPVIERGASAPEEAKKSGDASGTGFFVGDSGEVLTNAHVVDGCIRITVRTLEGEESDASVKGFDQGIDLAVLRTRLGPPAVARFRSGRSIRPGEDVVVFGFPLSNILSSRGNVTRGSVSALSGLGDYSAHLQISAPIQPGNSGGPLMDMGGNVVGVIVSKLSDQASVELTGGISQNVNFAIKRRMAEEFLDSNDVAYQVGGAGGNMPAVDVAEGAKRFTVKIECRY